MSLAEFENLSLRRANWYVNRMKEQKDFEKREADKIKGKRKG